MNTSYGELKRLMNDGKLAVPRDESLVNELVHWANKLARTYTVQYSPPIMWEPSAVDRLAGLADRALQERIDNSDAFKALMANINTGGTRIGRFSCKTPAFSNIPKPAALS